MIQKSKSTNLIHYPLSALRIVKQKIISRDENLEKRLGYCCRLLDSTLLEIKEHGLNFDRDHAKTKLGILEGKTMLIRYLLQ